MVWSKKRMVTWGICIVFPAMVTGCATVDRKVNVFYQPVVHGPGGSGEIYVAVTGGQPRLPGKTAVQWVVGKVKTRDGEKTGDVVMTNAPDDLAMDAFKQELTAAGYKVMPVDALPEEVTKGVGIAGATVELDETSDFIKSEGISRLSVSVELWKNGRKFKKLDYKSMLSDFAIKDRDRLLPTLLQKALQEVMKQAIPEIVRALEG